MRHHGVSSLKMQKVVRARHHHSPPSRPQSAQRVTTEQLIYTYLTHDRGGRVRTTCHMRVPNAANAIAHAICNGHFSSTFHLHGHPFLVHQCSKGIILAPRRSAPIALTFFRDIKAWCQSLETSAPRLRATNTRKMVLVQAQRNVIGFCS